MNTLADIYLKAAAVIESNGHAKHSFYHVPESPVGFEPARCEWPVCAAGALSVAIFGDPVPPSDGADGRDDYDAAVARLTARIDDIHLYSFAGDCPVQRLGGWNDTPDRTPADVIALFERTAREVA